LFRQLDSDTSLIQADKELPAGVIGREAEHFTRPHMRMAPQQVIDNSFVSRIETGHDIPLSA